MTYSKYRFSVLLPPLDETRQTMTLTEQGVVQVIVNYTYIYSLADYQRQHSIDFSEYHPMVSFTHDLMQEMFANISGVDCKEAYICIPSLLALDKSAV